MASWNFSIFVTILAFLRNFRCNADCIIDVKADIVADSPAVIFFFSLQNPRTTTHAIHDRKYLYPSDSWTQFAKDKKKLIFKKDASVYFVCLPKTIRNKPALHPGVMTIKGIPCGCSKKEFKCISNNKFQTLVNMKNEEFEFKDVKCAYEKGKSYAAILRDTQKECEDMTPASTPIAVPSTSDMRLFEVLYDLGNGDELKTLELCHDTQTSNTLWAHSFIIPENQDGVRYTSPDDSSKRSKTFKTGNLFKDMNWIKPNPNIEKQDSEIMARQIIKDSKDTEPYRKMAQWKTARFLLGDSNEADKYFCGVTASNGNNDMKYLAKGHLIANGDKLYKSEQDSTYFLANVLPMWQSINANPGYWYIVESKVRHLALTKERKLLIWAGGIDILEFPDVHGTNVKYFLDPVGRPSTSNAFPSSPKRRKISYQQIDKMPAPMIIFKIVVDEKEEEALVFLVVNHPNVDPNNLDPKYMVCPQYVEANDPCRNGGLLRAQNGRNRGYLYCCKLQNFYDQNADHLRLKNRLAPYAKYASLTLT